MKFIYFASLFAAIFALGRAAEVKPTLESTLGDAKKSAESFFAELVKNGKLTTEQAKKFLEDHTTQQKLDKYRSTVSDTYEGLEDKIFEWFENRDKNIEELKANIFSRINKLRYEPIEATVGVALIGAGLFLLFRGRSMFKVFLALSGFIMGGCAGLYLTKLAELLEPYGYELVDWHQWLITLVLAIVGSIIVTKAYKYSVVLISMFSGIFMAMIGIALSGFVLETYQTYLIVIASAIIFGFLSRKFEEALVITATAIMGSFVTVFGMDSIYNFGFRDYMNSLIALHDKGKDFVNFVAAPEGNTLRGVLVGAIFLAVCGIYTQYRFLPRSYGKN